MPSKKILSSLTSNDYRQDIKTWLCNQTIDPEAQLLISLDTLLYGGLIPSRRHQEDIQTLQGYLNHFLETVSSNNIYAFSSIMRISNNNINEEEVQYWQNYGVDIFLYSYLYHKSQIQALTGEEEEALVELKAKIPPPLLKDYRNRRTINHHMNLSYLDLQQQQYFKGLVFGQDDSGQYGMNVAEYGEIESIILQNHLKAQIAVGMDEIPQSILAQILVTYYDMPVKIFPYFLPSENQHMIPRYESLPLQESVRSKIILSGGVLEENYDHADVILYILAHPEGQGDHAMGLYLSFPCKSIIDKAIDKIQETDKPYAIADLFYANGCEDYFIKSLLNKTSSEFLTGFGGWNTANNSLGSAISSSIITFIAKEKNIFNENAHKQVLLSRLLDDWAYQANIRQILRQDAPNTMVDHKALYTYFDPYIQQLQDFLQYQRSSNLSFYFPWQRTFEIGISL